MWTERHCLLKHVIQPRVCVEVIVLSPLPLSRGLIFFPASRWKILAADVRDQLTPRRNSSCRTGRSVAIFIS
jgi:hypothetical protein